MAARFDGLGSSSTVFAPIAAVAPSSPVDMIPQLALALPVPDQGQASMQSRQRASMVNGV